MWRKKRVREVITWKRRIGLERGQRAAPGQEETDQQQERNQKRRGAQRWSERTRQKEKVKERGGKKQRQVEKRWRGEKCREMKRCGEEETRNEAKRGEAKLNENKWHVDQRDATWWRVMSQPRERSQERKEEAKWRQGKWCHLKRREVKWKGSMWCQSKTVEKRSWMKRSEMTRSYVIRIRERSEVKLRRKRKSAVEWRDAKTREQHWGKNGEK